MTVTDPTVPQDFNALYDRATRAARGVAAAAAPAAHAAVDRMAAEVPGLDVHLDEVTQNPLQVKTVEPVGRLSTRAAATPETAARQFVQDRADLWRRCHRR
jgi:extracellular elastinolytic metalloproteinase